MVAGSWTGFLDPFGDLALQYPFGSINALVSGIASAVLCTLCSGEAAALDPITFPSISPMSAASPDSLGLERHGVSWLTPLCLGSLWVPLVVALRPRLWPEMFASSQRPLLASGRNVLNEAPCALPYAVM